MTWFGIHRVKDWDQIYLGRVYPFCLSYRTSWGRPPIPGIRPLTPSISLTVLPISIWLDWSVVLSWLYGFTCLQCGWCTCLKNLGTLKAHHSHSEWTTSQVSKLPKTQNMEKWSIWRWNTTGSGIRLIKWCHPVKIVLTFSLRVFLKTFMNSNAHYWDYKDRS